MSITRKPDSCNLENKTVSKQRKSTAEQNGNCFHSLLELLAADTISLPDCEVMEETIRRAFFARQYGEMSERFMESVLKTDGEFSSVGSNPTLSATEVRMKSCLKRSSLSREGGARTGVRVQVSMPKYKVHEPAIQNQK